MNIVTEDIPETELLHILKSSRTRKKYYSLKIGAFVDLEDFLPKIPPIIFIYFHRLHILDYLICYLYHQKR